MTTNNVYCVHINLYQIDELKSSYELVHAHYISRIVDDSIKVKLKEPWCMMESCIERYNKRIHACLLCPHFGCFKQRHIHDHASKENHHLAVDINSGRVYCFSCKDYQYYSDLEEISKRFFLIAARQRGRITGLLYNWEPNKEDLAIIGNQTVINASKIAPRRLINMTNTCYMNVIIQSLVHAPAFRDYLLSLTHKCKFQNEALADPFCSICEMSGIVQEFVSGKKDLFHPDRLLLLMSCKKDKAVLGDDQQDAHQFLLALLDGMHLDCNEFRSNSSSSDLLCNCFIDTIFTGLLEYHSTCNECQNVSTRDDVFKYIKVEVSSPESEDVKDLSFTDCLMRSSQQVLYEYKCSSCLQKVSCNIQAIPKRLPPVICFYVKQPGGNQKTLHYNEFLDMSVLMHQRKKKMSFDNHFKYYLFAIVEHISATDKMAEGGGHYKCYVRQHKNNWFSCDDNIVEPIKLEDALNKQAYLLFYHRMFPSSE